MSGGFQGHKERSLHQEKQPDDRESQQRADRRQRCDERRAERHVRDPPFPRLMRMMVNLLLNLLGRGFDFFHSESLNPCPNPDATATPPPAEADIRLRRSPCERSY